MEYTKDFVDAVKSEYPDWDDLHKALDTGNIFVGRYLDDSCAVGISPRHIVEMIDSGRSKDLKVEAEGYLRRGKLYSWWCEITAKLR